jgi:single-strand DNA-binding protein
MHNCLALIGNLGADPDIRYAGSGTCVANLRLAVNDYGKDSNGNRVQKTYWFTCVAFGTTAEILGQYAAKGHKIGVVGKLIQREWEDQSGNKRSAIEVRIDTVELLGAPGGNSKGQSQNQAANRQPPQRAGGNGVSESLPPPPPDFDPSDDVPF